MSESSRENVENKYVSLKEALLNGSVSIDEVRKNLMVLDQSTTTRDASEENLNFMLDPDIMDYVAKHPETSSVYHDFLSFTEFHVAQRYALDSSPEATDHFRKALENAQISKAHKSWAAYVESTLLYIQGQEIPEELILKAELPRNMQILKNFNMGLKERGAPSYKEDYSK
jgi:hypothetical protein